jgi:hypothetical protein
LRITHELEDFNPSTYEELMAKRPMYPIPVPQVGTPEWIKWYTAIPHWIKSKARFMNSHHIDEIIEMEAVTRRNRQRVHVTGS